MAAQFYTGSGRGRSGREHGVDAGGQDVDHGPQVLGARCSAAGTGTWCRPAGAAARPGAAPRRRRGSRCARRGSSGAAVGASAGRPRPSAPPTRRLRRNGRRWRPAPPSRSRSSWPPCAHLRQHVLLGVDVQGGQGHRHPQRVAGVGVRVQERLALERSRRRRRRRSASVVSTADSGRKPAGQPLGQHREVGQRRRPAPRAPGGWPACAPSRPMPAAISSAIR